MDVELGMMENQAVCGSQQEIYCNKRVTFSFHNFGSGDSSYAHFTHGIQILSIIIICP